MNLNSNCNNLDAYLSDDLPVDQRTLFESHLDTCSVCRDAVEQQQWIDDLLQSPARIQLEQPPTTIADSFRVSLAERRRRILRAAGGLAVAATLLIAAGWQALSRPALVPAKAEQTNVAIAKPSLAPQTARPQATFVSTAEAIVMPIDSQSSDVTIVQVFPTTDAERQSRLEATLSPRL